jgi:hypothetical protein
VDDFAALPRLAQLPSAGRAEAGVAEDEVSQVAQATQSGTTRPERARTTPLARQRFSLCLLAAALLALLLAPRPAAAQSVASDGRGEMSVGRSYYESRGPGYSVYVPSANYAGAYQFYPGYYTGYPIVSRFAGGTGYYSTTSSGYSPIFMTSLNYPTVYGSYSMQPSGNMYNTAPVFQTRPDNLPSDNTVGAPYAPLSRPLMDVPPPSGTELTARLDLPSRSALIDV